MITQRDVFVAVVAVCATIATVAVADSIVKPAVMSSTVWNWDSLKAEPMKFGARREVFQGRTATLDQLACHITTLNPGQAPHDAHHHPEEELLVVKEGTLLVMQNGVTNRAGPGAIIFQASNQEHGLRNDGDVPVTYYVFKWFPPGMLKSKPE